MGLISTRRAITGMAMGGGYSKKVLKTGPIAYWPLWETAGAVARCLVNPAQNGTAVGVTWANDATNSVTGTAAPFFDGANDYVDVLTAALIAAFNGAEGSLMAWAKVNAAGVWTDGANRFTTVLRADNNNRVFMQKAITNNRFRWTRVGGGVVEQQENVAIANTNWMCMAITWSQSADQVRAYYNGVQDGLTMTVLGAFAGALAIANIGAETVVPGNVWHGWLQHCVVWNRALTPGEIAGLAV